MMSDECEYCSVCRYNHSEGRKHVYVKYHQQKLSVILNKFGEKVQLAEVSVTKYNSVRDSESLESWLENPGNLGFQIRFHGN